MPMSRVYKFSDQNQLYFVSFATVNWIDVFIRNEYREILLESLRYCQLNKDLELYAWVIMTNHVHLIIGTRGGPMGNILRDLKKFTANKILEAIQNNPKESRKEWMLWMFERAGRKNPNNENYQFWQQHNQPIELFARHIMTQKLDYLHENPVTAGFVSKPEDWLFSSAIDYYTNQKGKLDILLIE
jgi:putative transposase